MLQTLVQSGGPAISAVWVPPGEECGKDHIGGATTHFSFDVGGGDSEDQGSGDALFHELRYCGTQAFRKMDAGAH